MAETGAMTHYGPKRGERSRRHQMLVEALSSRRDPPQAGIVTMYEVADDEQPRLHIEVMVDGYTDVLRLTVDEARELAGACAEFVRCWEPASSPTEASDSSAERGRSTDG